MIGFILTNILLGIGLAMDAFSVSTVNGLREPQMRTGKKLKIAGTFGWFQFAMPMVGWIFVHTLLEYFKKFEILIPWIALSLLLFIGGKMIFEIVSENLEKKELRREKKDKKDKKDKKEQKEQKKQKKQKEVLESEVLESEVLANSAELEEADADSNSSEARGVGKLELFIQGIATSIDALSVGFTIAVYGALSAFSASMIIGVVTFITSVFGIKLGQVAGEKLNDKATVIGGIILICIGIEIFVKGVFLK